MRSVVWLGILIGASAISFAQPQLDWRRVYNHQERRTAWDHCSTPDGGYLLAAETGFVREDVWDALVMKVDAEGRLEWERRLGNQNDNETLRAVVLADDGGCAVAGVSSVNNSDFLVLRLDEFGDIVWSNTYGGNLHEFATGITGDGEGGFLICGKRADNGYIIRIDGDGELIWERIYDFGGQYDVFTNIVSREGDYALCGSGGNARQPLLAIIDGEGELIFSRIFNHDDNRGRMIWDFDITADGGFIMVGHVNLAPGGNGMLLRLDAEGNRLWSRNYDGPRDRQNTSFACAVASLQDGRIALCGNTDNADFWALWVDADGNPVAQDHTAGNGWSARAGNGTVTFAGSDGYNVLLQQYVLPPPVHTLRLAANWDIYSTYLVPDDPNIPALMAPLVGRGSLIIIKNQSGQFYSPRFNFSNLPPWDVHSGYMIKMTRPDSLVITGQPVQEDEALFLLENWNMIAYFPVDAMDAPAALAGLGERLVLAKDGRGNFYNPAQNFNNMPPLHRGAGYMIKVDRDVEFQWGGR
ncbi:MAG: hypothetical protein FJY67_06790 [Calditrichaeota bacterium]|nr:hypothetical protein [Calditrichota bacterium]